ncbi:hypothetical protein Tco_1103909 [Tanacetum coccineum]
MMEKFSLLKEYTKGKAHEKVFVREEVSKPVTKYVNVISLVRIEDDKNEKCDESDGSMSKDSTRWGKYADRLTEMHRSRPIDYYLKSEINKKTIEDLVDNHKYNDSLLATCLGNMDSETYKSLPIGSMYDTILIQKLARKKGWEGNFVISIRSGEHARNQQQIFSRM